MLCVKPNNRFPIVEHDARKIPCSCDCARDSNSRPNVRRFRDYQLNHRGDRLLVLEVVEVKQNNVLTKQCVQRQQGCLQCCRASCRLGVESTAEVVHKSAVATRCASEQKESIETCHLLLTDFQSQVCLGDEKE